MLHGPIRRCTLIRILWLRFSVHSILMIAECQEQKFALTYFHVFPALGVVLLPHDGRPPLPNLVP